MSYSYGERSFGVNAPDQLAARKAARELAGQHYGVRAVKHWEVARVLPTQPGTRYTVVFRYPTTR